MTDNDPNRTDARGRGGNPPKLTLVSSRGEAPIDDVSVAAQEGWVGDETARIAPADAERVPVQGPESELGEKLRVLEAVLFAAPEPVSADALAKHLNPDDDVVALLKTLQQSYEGRGINLVVVAGKWTFRTAPDLAHLLRHYAVETRRLSKAALETLSIIAYHQPVTRAEIEEVRGVTTSVGTLDILLETGWVRLRGRRRAPGRPVTYGTTDAFLSHFGLEAIKDLPGLAELKGAGLLDSSLPANFKMPDPSDVAALMPDELPLDSPEEDDDESSDVDEFREECSDDTDSSDGEEFAKRAPGSD